MPKRGRDDDSDSDLGIADNHSEDDEYSASDDDEEEEFDERQESGKRVIRSNQTRRIGIRRATVGRSFDPLADDVRVFQDYSNDLQLKPDHEKRPIWITADNYIYLEAFSPIYQQAYDFLVAIAEPESRPEFVHIYKLTENSLYAAVAVSIDTESIITVLSRLCKTDVPQQVVDYIRSCTQTFGKAKIVLKENKFYIESRYPDILRELLKNPIIKSARVVEGGPNVNGSDSESDSDDGRNNGRAAAAATAAAADEFLTSAAPVEDARNLSYTKLGTEEGVEDEDEDMLMDELKAGGINASAMSAGSYRSKIQTVSFQIRQEEVQLVKRSAKEESHYPLMEEYDFKNDTNNPVLDIDLRPSTRIRVSCSLIDYPTPYCC